MRKCLKVEYFGLTKYDFQKSRVTGPQDHKVSVSAKKVEKKFHACVPLMANYCTRCRKIFKGLSHNGGRADFSKKPPQHFRL